MSSLIHWQRNDNTLYLEGVLDRDTLNFMWGERAQWEHSIVVINVSKLTRVDSAGLALLVYACTMFSISLSGISTQLETLIKLYNLQSVIKLENE